MCTRKNTLFLELLNARGPKVIDSSISLLKTLKREGFRIGVISSSLNCECILRLAGLEGLYDVRVDDEVLRREELKEKPQPDMLLAAAKAMECFPGECLVMDDALVHGREIYNNDFVNCPNWLPVEFRIGNSDFVSPLAMDLLSYKHELDLRHGMKIRTMVCRDSHGLITRIQSRRLASMAEPHLCALRFELTPINYSAPITVRVCLDGNVDEEVLQLLSGRCTECAFPDDPLPMDWGISV